MKRAFYVIFVVAFLRPRFMHNYIRARKIEIKTLEMKKETEKV